MRQHRSRFLWIVIALFALESRAQTTARVSIDANTGDALRITSAANHLWTIGPNSGSAAGFAFHDFSAGQTRLLIGLDGNVGIGTSSPQTRLDVAGQVRSSSGGFVFPDGTVQTSAATETGGGGVQQVVRGVITFPATSHEVRQNFSPPIDPTKSVVIVGTPVFTEFTTTNTSHSYTRLGATLIELTSTQITIAIDKPAPTSDRVFPCRVSFQIIQYK